ncbi:hypothetical protein BDY24DRAFT_386188 [Mrakia frigida]|uniref:uncharacterized protein n=1 Tax=Mrakia frigida TaxID=29902 RepID=UPI003FCC1A2D
MTSQTLFRFGSRLWSFSSLPPNPHTISPHPPSMASRPSTTRSLPLLLSLGSRLVRASPIFVASAAVASSVDVLGSHHEEAPMNRSEYLSKLVISSALVVIGGVFAGLTLGLMGLEPLHLKVLSTSSDNATERKHADRVLRLLNRGRHWVLVVLLLGNVIVNESLPIFLDKVLGGGISAVIASTVLIVIFGEIIPQSVCVRYGLAVGSYASPFVLFMMYAFAPVAWPIAKLLDYVLGANEEHTYKKAELKSFLQFHKTGEEPLRDDEILILNGVLSLNQTSAGDIMTPIGDVMTLSVDTILDHDMLDKILLSGFSRIPIHEVGRPKSFIGMLLIKRLLTYNPEEALPVSSFPLSTLPEAKATINCFQALDYFQTGRAHLLLISDSPGKPEGALGVISLEDLIEEIIGEEIVDETDRYMSNTGKKAARRTSSAEVMKGIIERERKKLVRMNSIISVEEAVGSPRKRAGSETASLLRNGAGANGENITPYGSLISTSPTGI